MSKTRVYELAKELGVDTKTLIERVKGETAIAVENHLTALSPEEAARIRTLFMVPREGDIVERRIRPTVIRRRTRHDKQFGAGDEGVGGGEALEAVASQHVEPVDLPPIPVAEVAEAPEPIEGAPPFQPEEIAPEPPAAVPVELPPVPDEIHIVEVEVVAAAPEPPEAAPIEFHEESLPEAPSIVEAPEYEAPTTVTEAVEEPGYTEIAEPEISFEGELEEPSEESGDAVADPISRRRPGPLYANAEVTARVPQAEQKAKVLDRIEIKPERPLRPVRPARPAAPVRPARSGPGGPGGPPPSPTPGAPDSPGGPAPGKDVGRRRAGGGKRVYDRQRDDNREKNFWDGGAGRGGRKRRKGAKVVKRQSMTPLTIPKAAKRVVRMGEVITVGDLAQALSVKAAEIQRKLMLDYQMMATINQTLDFDTTTLIATEYEFTVESIAFEEDQYIQAEMDRDEDLVPRAPVITIMGHVDHGKTSLLDAIQHSRIAERESGGITQHIGAYQVELDGRLLTFIDTPGHEAFTAMRARGAQVTDIVILVVAADDGVMPQTVEAINHARAAGVPIVVAVNKVDKDNADPQRVRQALTEHQMVAEEWGGETIFVDVSAKTGVGLDRLLEMVLLQAEVLELHANPNKRAKGIVIEAKLDPRRGPVATLLVQEGTLRPGDTVVTGSVYGRVRWITNDRGEMIDEAGPSTPVEVAGLSDVPVASDIFNAVEDDKKARTLAEHRAEKERETRLAKPARISLERFLDQMGEVERKELKIVLKADVQGSIEAIRNALERLSNDEVEVRIIQAAAGGISENDVNLATASDAVIIGFNVRPEVNAKNLADQEGVDLKLYSVIYDAVEDVKLALTGMLAPTLREVVLGHAQVRELFQIPKAGMVAGVMVTDGKVVRGSQVRLVRDSVVVWRGRMSSLRRFKEDAKEVKDGYECGIGLDGYNDIKLGDVIESFEMQETPGVL